MLKIKRATYRFYQKNMYITMKFLKFSNKK